MLRKLWSGIIGSDRKSRQPERPRLFLDEMPAAIYAIGDIHGCHRQLKALEEKIVEDAAMIEGEKWLVCLGDYIDRGPASAMVLDHLIARPPAGFRRFCIAGNHEHIAYDFIRKLRADPRRLQVLGDGHQSKSYVHVSDVVSAVFFVLDKEREPVNLYNVATDDYVTVRWIADCVRELMKLPDAQLDFTGGSRGWSGDVPVVRFDLAKIHGLGWSARHGSRDAIRRSIIEMLADPDGPAARGECRP